LAPYIVTMSPLPVELGLKEEIAGAEMNVNPDLVAVPPDVVTLTDPDDPEETMALIWVAEATVKL
jgi:hypothetical protein